jgi:hypothetical protein
MADEDAIQKFAKLSQRERQVLGLVCNGMEQKDIALTLFISLSTVKTVMGRVYVKLGLDQLDKAGRAKAIYQIYCPILTNSTQIPESMPPEINEPVSEETMDKVNEDEFGLMVIPPQPIIHISERKKESFESREPRRSRAGWLMIILIIFCILGILYFLRGLIFPNSGTSISIPQIVTATENIISDNTIAPAPTLTQSLPQATSTTQVVVIEPTNPPQPTATLLPTSTVPAIALPITDNFDNGASSTWQVLNGNWLTANGRYTIADADNTWEFSILNDPTWTNYQIKTNIIMEKSDEGEVAIIVRYLSSENKFLAFHIVNIFSKGGWALYDGNEFTNISGYGEIAIPQQYDLEIDVTGNQYTARINGMTTQQINMSGYDHGGIGLGISCFYASCASFDNFQVNPAP